jgi:MFS transporter, ACDE family, multidrug resistance protein
VDRRPRRHWLLASSTAVAVMFGVQGIAAALPAIQQELHIGDSQLGLFTAAYLLPAVVLAVPLGYLADALGRRWVFIAMAVVFGAAGLAQAWVTDYGALLALRLLQGIGFAALMPLTITLIGDVYRGAAQLRAQAGRQLVMAASEFALPLVGAALATISWHAPLAAQGVLLPIALAGLLVLQPADRERASERYGRALVDAVRRPGMPAVLGAGFMRFMCKFAVISYLPVMLVQDGATLGQAALVLGVGSGVAALVNVQTVRLAPHVPTSRLLSAAVVLVGAAVIGYAVAPRWEAALVAAVAFGVGDGIVMVLQNALVTEAAGDGIRGGLVAVSSATRNAGKMAAPLVMGAVIAVAPISVAFVVVGALTWAVVPALRPLRLLDGLLRYERGTPVSVEP